jgi:hypothetical protein
MSVSGRQKSVCEFVFFPYMKMVGLVGIARPLIDHGSACAHEPIKSIGCHAK